MRSLFTFFSFLICFFLPMTTYCLECRQDFTGYYDFLTALTSGNDKTVCSAESIDARQTGVVRADLFLDQADLDFLYERDPHSDSRVPATGRIGEKGFLQPLEGVRFRGRSSRGLPKKSFNIRFMLGQELLFGSPRLNANAMYTDPSMMRERLAFEMFHELGRPAPRTMYLDLWINGVFEGLYLHVERVDEVLLHNAGLNPQGTLVRDRLRVITSDEFFSVFGFPISEVHEQERETFLSRTFNSRGTPDWNHLAEFILWAEESEPGIDFAREFEARVDMDVFIDWMAIHFLIGDIDSWADDYWLYLDNEDSDARWLVIPWDKDLSFGSKWRPEYGTANDFFSYEQPIEPGWNNQLLKLFLKTPELYGKLFGRLQFLMNEVFTPDYFMHRIAAVWNVIRDSAPLQPNECGHLGLKRFALHPGNHFSYKDVTELHMEALLDFIELRYAYLDRVINPVEGESYFATKELKDLEPGQVIMFTDPQGWTIARLVVVDSPGGQGRISLGVVHDANQSGLDRVWMLESTAPAMEALITVYFRNEHPDYLNRKNWYTEGPYPVDRQWELVMGRKGEKGIVPFADSRVNPFSNKIEALVSIEPDYTHEFVVSFPD